MAQRWKQWCRLCAREDDGDCTAISQFREGIRKCFSINISEYDRLPQTVCSKCSQLISTIIRFSENAVKAQEMFSEFLISLDDIDHRQLKALYGLQESDEKDGFKEFAKCPRSPERLSDSKNIDLITIGNVGVGDTHARVKIEEIDENNPNACAISTHVKIESMDGDDKTDMCVTISDKTRHITIENIDECEPNTPVKIKGIDKNDNKDASNTNTCVKIKSIDEDDNRNGGNKDTRVKVENTDGNDNMEICVPISDVSKQMFDVTTIEGINECDTSPRVKVESIHESDKSDMYGTTSDTMKQIIDAFTIEDIEECEPNTPIKIEGIDKNDNKDASNTNTCVKIESIDGDDNRNKDARIKIERIDEAMPATQERQNELDEQPSPNCPSHSPGVSDKNQTRPKKNTVIKPRSKRDDFICPECKKLFWTYMKFRYHMQFEHGIFLDRQRFPCIKCDKVFETAGRLRFHERFHLPLELKRTIPCPYCDKKFTKNSNLRGHLSSIHKCMKTFIDEECGKSFATYEALRDHRLLHLDKRRFECSQCKTRFKDRYRLKRHEQSHRERIHICTVCGLKFNKRRTLTTHLIVHFGEKVFRCQFCGTEYKRAKYFRDHIIMHKKRLAMDATGANGKKSMAIRKAVNEDDAPQSVGSESDFSDTVSVILLQTDSEQEMSDYVLGS